MVEPAVHGTPFREPRAWCQFALSITSVKGVRHTNQIKSVENKLAGGGSDWVGFEGRSESGGLRTQVWESSL